MGLVETLRRVPQEAPFLWLLVGAWLAAVVLAVVALVWASRTLKRAAKIQRAAVLGDWEPAKQTGPLSRMLEMVALGPALLIVGATGFAVERSRNWVLQGVLSTDLGERATLISRGLTGELTSILLGLSCATVPVLMGSLAAAWAVSARFRTASLVRGAALSKSDPDAASHLAAHPGPPTTVILAGTAAFDLLGLAPIAWGAFRATLLKFERFATLAAVEPSLKVASFEEAQVHAGAVLERGFHLAVAGSAVAALLSAVLLWRTSVNHGAAAVRPQPRGSSALIVGVFTLAGAFFLLARPMKRENETVWPAGSVQRVFGARTPGLEGPDPVEVGPVLQVAGEQLTLDRQAVDLAELEKRLGAYRDNYALLHPGEAFPARLLLLCSPNAPETSIFEALGTAARVQYRFVTFAFERHTEVARPYLGRLPWSRVSGASARLVKTPVSGEPDTVVVQRGATSTCAALSRRVVVGREQKHAVVLLVGDASAPEPAP